METCADCGLPITEDQQSCYIPSDVEEFGRTYHLVCFEAKADLAAARRALADFEKRGGTSLEDLRKELGL